MNIEFEIGMGSLKTLPERVEQAVKGLNSNMRGEWIKSVEPHKNEWIKSTLLSLTSSHRHTNGELVWVSTPDYVGWEHTGNCVGDEGAYFLIESGEIKANRESLEIVAYEMMFGEPLWLAERLDQERVGLSKINKQIKNLLEKKEIIEKQIKFLL